MAFAPRVAAAQFPQKLEKLIWSPPRLSFGASQPIEFDFPILEHPQPIIDSFRARIQARRKGYDQEDLQLVPPGAQRILAGLKKGTHKLEYGKTSADEWDKYFRFASDALDVGKRARTGRQYRIVGGADEKWISGTPVNQTRAVAHDWFLNYLIPSVRGNTSARHFIIGDPGSGKSTLIKYLINSNYESLKAQRVVFSRFEFMKFMSRWYQGRELLPRQLDEYISYILLRDLITHIYFALDRAGGFKPFWRQHQSMEEFRAALHTITGTRLPHADTIVEVLWSILSATTYNVAELWNIPVLERIGLIKHLRGERMIVLVLDGLDYISVDDILTESDRHDTLDYILSNNNGLASFSTVVANDPGLNVRSLTIIREGTLGIKLHERKNDVGADAPYRYRVQEIKPRVAAFNALKRSLDAFAEGDKKKLADAETISHLLMRAIDGTMGIINVSVGSPFTTEQVYDLFGGNLRTLFDFIRRLLLWFVAEAVRDPDINLGLNTSSEEVLASMITARGQALLIRRKYRLVELLLFSELPWFENAILAEKPDALLAAFRKAKGPSIVESDLFTGVLDNAFNYNDWTHKAAASQHSFLEKIRIMQILIERPMASSDLESELLSTFGYSTKNLVESLAILIRSECVKFRFVHDNKLELYATARATFLVAHLCNEMSYLEHTFHRTLFPKQLIAGLNDERREAGVEAWATASIRNCFIFLTYINFVESTRAGGVSVPNRYRITERTKRRLRMTIARILGATDARHHGRHDDEGTPPRGQEVVMAAINQIERLIGQWQKANLLADTPRSGTTSHE